MRLSPIVLFVYNRPWHTAQTLVALNKNDIAKRSKLIIYADGPRDSSDESEIAKIKSVRDQLRRKKWCGKVEIVERDKNKGLFNNIVEGVTEVMDAYGRAIVLEDDVVTSPLFLSFLNKNLHRFESEETVFGIGAYLHPIPTQRVHNVFLRNAFCWGWGTWKNRWDKVQFGGADLKDQIAQQGLTKEFNRPNKHYWDMLEAGKSWAIRYYASAFLQEGLFLYPCRSLVNNIGHDGSGENCTQTDQFQSNELLNSECPNPSTITEDSETLRLIEEYLNSSQNRTFFRRLSSYFIK